MRLLVLGATGGTGRELVTQALADGHDVTAFVRDVAKLPPGSIRTVTGDIVRNPQQLDAAMRDQDAVVSTLGVGQSFKSGGLIGKAAPAIIDAMGRTGVRRLVFMSAFGVGPTWPDTPLVPRLFMRTLLRDVYADKAAGETAIMRSALEWTIVYPTGLSDGPRTDRVRVGEHLPLKGFPTVSRADVAAAILRLLGDGTAVRKSLLIAN